MTEKRQCDECHEALLRLIRAVRGIDGEDMKAALENADAVLSKYWTYQGGA